MIRFVVGLTLLFSLPLWGNDILTVESGKFTNVSKIQSSKVFQEKLLDLDEFVRVFLKVNEIEDFEICQGWPNYIYVKGKSTMPLCASANLFGFEIRISSDVKVYEVKSKNCQKAVLYDLKFSDDTKPVQLVENVKNLRAHICYKGPGKISYYTYAEKGDNTSMILFPIVEGELKDISPYFIKTVEHLFIK